MKKNIQNELIKYLTNINYYLKIINNSKLHKKILFPAGLLEWDNEEKKFYKITITKENKLENLLCIDNQKKTLVNNTLSFLKGNPANSVLLWGARGTGKSSLILSVYSYLKKKYSFSMIELKFFQIKYLSKIIRLLEKEKKKIIIFCDDFSFERSDESYIYFKNVIEGSIRNNPNILFYVTSNYRHLIRDDQVNSINTILEKENLENFTSLSDRFGIWLGFHTFKNEEYMKVIIHYAHLYQVKLELKKLKLKATEWSIARGSKSGREAKNFIKYIISVQ